VYLAFRDCGELSRVADSVDEFFGDLLKSSDGAEVDWSEAERLPVLARERLDLTAHYRGVPASLDQALCRAAGALVLFVRRRVGDEETLTRTTLPEPLVADLCSVQPVQPDRTDIWTIHLQPRRSDGIVKTEATRTSAGRWKNSTSHGVPIYDSVWSADRGRLKTLRAELLGPERAARIAERDDAQQELQARLDTLPPAARRAALMEMARQATAETDRLFQEQFPGIGEPPPEIAALTAIMEGKLREARRRFQGEAAQDPLDPETRRLIERVRKLSRPDAGD
jgi:hypothetical protein